MASGINSTFRQVGIATGIAASGRSSSICWRPRRPGRWPACPGVLASGQVKLFPAAAQAPFREIFTASLGELFVSRRSWPSRAPCCRPCCCARATSRPPRLRAARARRRVAHLYTGAPAPCSCPAPRLPPVRRRQRLRRRVPRRPGRPAPDAAADHRRGAQAHGLPLPATAASAPPATRSRAARAAARRARAVLRPAPRLLAGRAPASALGHPTYLLEYGDIALLRPRPGPRALGRGHHPDGDPPRQRGRRRRPGAARRLVPGRDHGAARRGRRQELPVNVGGDGRRARSTSRRCAIVAPCGPWPTSPAACSGPRSTARWAARPRRWSSAPSSSRRSTST